MKKSHAAGKTAKAKYDRNRERLTAKAVAQRLNPPSPPGLGISVTDITNHALDVLKYSLRLPRFVNRDYQAAFSPDQKIGAIINVRKLPHCKP